MDSVFKALADPTRRAILDCLNESNGQTLGELCERFAMTRQAVMKHLAVLEAANLVVAVKQGREKLHYLNPVPINDIHERWIGKYERQHVEALGTLKRSLEETKTGNAEDESTMDKPNFVYITYINTTPEKLWEALTNPEFTKQYWGGRRIESDWKIGSPVKFVDPQGKSGNPGEVLEFEPPRLLSYTWSSNLPSRVIFRLEPYGNVMRLTVTHMGLEPGSKEFEMTSQGWFAIMSSLKSLLETGKALSYPWKG
jgi:uncharacterized protein YndB with AHSA1/START domain/DNA-binding transcriptional ArsR family regulator